MDKRKQKEESKEPRIGYEEPNLFKEFLLTYRWAILVVLFAIGALAYFGVINIPYLTNENEWCKIRPDKCVCAEVTSVCENNQKIINREVNEGCLNSKFKIEYCSKFKKKSPQELEIDYCNENLDDENKCHCEKYGANKDDKEFCDRFLNDTFCKNANISKGQFCMCSARNECTKSRPKTPCERGNPDWVEEKIYEERINIIPNKSEIINLPEHSFIQRIFTWNFCAENKTIQLQSCIPLSDGFEIVGENCSIKNLSYCSKRYGAIYNKTQIYKETICREKTDVEKLMDKGCDEIRARISYCDVAPYIMCIACVLCEDEEKEDLRQAWRLLNCTY